ncbi:hypothetical protein B0H14DRAFT_2648299 [Mycena olivaceomarginata]|nr:hypothetical protein B0H14DRAFT_2648299 [Mycena olivaceomarginata]
MRWEDGRKYPKCGFRRPLAVPLLLGERDWCEKTLINLTKTYFSGRLGPAPADERILLLGRNTSKTDQHKGRKARRLRFKAHPYSQAALHLPGSTILATGASNDDDNRTMSLPGPVNNTPASDSGYEIAPPENSTLVFAQQQARRAWVTNIK